MTAPMDPHAAARKRRNLILGLCLVAFVTVVYVVSIVQIRAGIAAP